VGAILSVVSANRPSREDLRRRVLGWRAAEAAEQYVRQGEPPLSPSESLAWAEQIIALNPAAMTAPDPVREREVELAMLAWQRLRVAKGWKPGDGTQG
jgi:hypothetical protein